MTVTEQTFTGIANAIRSKSGKVDTMKIEDMAQNILKLKVKSQATPSTTIIFSRNIERFERSWDESIETVIIEEGVTKIGRYAFYNCCNLRKVVFPSTLTTIETYAFSGCRNLSQLDMNGAQLTWVESAAVGSYSKIHLNVLDLSKAEYIGPNALSGISTSNLKLPSSPDVFGLSTYKWVDYTGSDFIFPSTWSYIPEYFCTYWTRLKRVLLPPALTEIKQYAFSNTGLNSISIPNTVTTIGNWAFGDCRCLKSLDIPDSVTTLGDCIVAGCWALRRFKMSNAITKYPVNLLNECSALIDLHLSDNLTTLDSSFGYHLYSLRTLTLPAGLTSIPRSVGLGANYNSLSTSYSFGALLTVICRGTTPPVINSSQWGSALTPAQLANPSYYGVRHIFVPMSAVNSYKLATNWAIYADIIQGYDDEHPIPDWESEIWCDSDLFTLTYGGKCTQHKTPSSIWYEGRKEYITHLILEEGCTHIPSRYGTRSSIRIVEFPSTVTTFSGLSGNYATGSSLESVIFTAPSLTEIGANTFQDCFCLESIDIPNIVTSIGTRAFRNCYNLEKLRIPPGVTELGREIFIGDIALNTVYTPKLGHEMFDYKVDTLKVLQATPLGGGELYGDGTKLDMDFVGEVMPVRLYDVTELTIRDITAVTTPSPDYAGNYYNIYSPTLEILNLNSPPHASISKLTLYQCPRLKEIRVPRGTINDYALLLPQHGELLVETDFDIESESPYEYIVDTESEYTASYTTTPLDDFAPSTIPEEYKTNLSPGSKILIRGIPHAGTYWGPVQDRHVFGNITFWNGSEKVDDIELQFSGPYGLESVDTEYIVGASWNTYHCKSDFPHDEVQSDSYGMTITLPDEVSTGMNVVIRVDLEYNDELKTVSSKVVCINVV